MDELILIGAGGHAKSVVEVITNATRNYEIEGILCPMQPDDTYWNRFSYLGNDEVNTTNIKGKQLHISVGMIKNLDIREELFLKYESKGGVFPVIRSANAYVSEFTKVKRGTIIMHMVLMNTGVSIGKNVILNTKCSIEHDVVIGDHSHIGPGAMINADCSIGKNTFISSNATINRGVSIGDKCIIGAGAVVTRDIPDGKVAFGVPAKIQN